MIVNPEQSSDSPHEYKPRAPLTNSDPELLVLVTALQETFNKPDLTDEEIEKRLKSDQIDTPVTPGAAVLREKGDSSTF